jgi:hypothetical protein
MKKLYIFLLIIFICGYNLPTFLGRFATFPLTLNDKINIAKSHCEHLAKAIQCYNYLEKKYLANLSELAEKYSTNIKFLRDPWGNSYILDLNKNTIYSLGPNGIKNRNDLINKENDDILFKYIGSLFIKYAKIKVNPFYDENQSTARDILHLYFNKKVVVNKDINIPLLSTGGQAEYMGICKRANLIKDHACPKYTFRWSGGKKDKFINCDVNPILTKFDNLKKIYIPCNSICEYKENLIWSNDIDQKIFKESKNGFIFKSINPKEIIIVLPAGTSGSIKPDYHFINLTGNSLNNDDGMGGTGNLYFKETDQKIGAVSAYPIMIKLYKNSPKIK